MKKTLMEAFEFVKGQGWNISVLEENFEDEKTMYGFSKDSINFLAVFTDSKDSTDICFVPTAENLASWINAAYVDDRPDLEKEMLFDLENKLMNFITED